MSVLLPATFSPMSAWTSPGATVKETFFRARVAPKLFCTPLIWRRGGVIGWRSLQILVQRRMEQILDVRLFHVFGRDEYHAGIEALFDFFSLQVFVKGHHSQITHEQGILHHQALDVA